MFGLIILSESSFVYSIEIIYYNESSSNGLGFLYAKFEYSHLRIAIPHAQNKV